ncbi:MAG: RNA 2',3'-cyclic phosphodiesterase [Nocardioidaceae bacterium]|nr:RNA 2',3'-cyclic phosphodiesterase [Nocardioidaceae bacterium]
MRVFAAVFPPDEAVDDLARVVEPIQQARTDLAWTVPPLWHLTLSYFGNITQVDQVLLNRAVADFVQGRRALRVRLAGAGAFPEPQTAQTLWAGLECPGNALGDLSRELILSLSHFGWMLDRRAFRTYLALAQAPNPTDLSPAVDQLADYSGPYWNLPAIAVVWSRVGEGDRPFYELLGEHPFLSA